MIIRQRLLAEMMSLIVKTELDDQLQQTITQILEIKPNNPYLFLQKKISLKQKMDNSKTSQYLLQITMYLTHIDPITNSQSLIKDKIISIYVQKYQHTKIKKSQIMQFINIILFVIDSLKKDYFMKTIQKLLDRQIFSILEFSNIIYQAIVFRTAISQIIKLQKRMQEYKITLTSTIVAQYFNTLNQNTSIIKKLGIELDDKDLYKAIAISVCQRIEI